MYVLTCSQSLILFASRHFPSSSYSLELTLIKFIIGGKPLPLSGKNSPTLIKTQSNLCLDRPTPKGADRNSARNNGLEQMQRNVNCNENSVLAMYIHIYNTYVLNIVMAVSCA